MDTTAPRVLVVDDERPIRRFLRLSLAKEYAVIEAEQGSQALDMVATSHPNLVLLDLGLPDMDGLDVIHQLRNWTEIPIIVLSVRSREEDTVAALDCGADDYLAKPFMIGELMARMRAALRHSSTCSDTLFTNGALSINMASRSVWVKGSLVDLTPVEYELLRVLVKHVGKVFTHHQLMKAVWGERKEVNAHLLRVNISNLRKKIESDPLRPAYIITEPGVGYRLKLVEE